MNSINEGRVAGKVALVSGGAQGMGAAHVRMLVRHGARVVIADLDEQQGNRLAEDLGDKAVFVRLDVSIPDEWESAVSIANSRFGEVSVLVNNAGVLLLNRVDDISLQDYRKTIEVNQIGVLLGMQAVIPGMKRAGRGSIVNIASSAAMVGMVDNFAYTASKWAVRGMTKAAALELAPFGIRVNAIAPGEVNTRMIADLDLAVSETPIGRFGSPEEIAYLALYLASDESSYTTGADHAIDGGYTAR